mgnify:CR=1 FL=1
MKNAIFATAVALGSISGVHAQETNTKSAVELQRYQNQVASNINAIVSQIPLTQGVRATSCKLEISDRVGSTTR